MPLREPLTDDIKKQVIARKAELIEFLSQAKKANNTRIPVQDKTQPLPLSFAQQRLWFLNQLEPDNTAYNMPSAIRISGDLRVDVLERVFSEILRRHEILRTVYREFDDTQLQLVQPSTTWNFEIEELDLGQTPTPGSAEEEQETHQLMQLSKDESSITFDLSQGPVMRSRLLRLRPQEFLVLITIHHIASDGWSMGILVSEIVALYRSYCEDKPSPLPDLGLQYADYAHWQTQPANTDALNLQLDYWREKLRATPVLQLPIDKARPTALGTDGNRIDFKINRSQTAQLNDLCQSQDATLFMVMLAIFNVLLHRLSQQDDFCVGIPIANRSNSALDSLVGCFVNTLALRSKLSGNPSFSAFLAQVKQLATEGFNHQDIPFERVVDELGVARDMSHTPVFQVMFTMQNVPFDNHVEMPGVNLEILEFERGTAQFELTLTIVERNDRLYAAFEYNTELFERDTIERVIHYFKRLVGEIISNPDQSVGHLPMLSDAERSQLLSHWNDTNASFPSLCVHELIEQQVKRSPDAIAVTCGDHSLSYSTLNQRANQLARHLRAQGLTVGDRVGLCVQASTEVLVALLAIQKAGGAYVPMDPNYPQERLAHIIDNAAIDLLLTQEELFDRLPPNNKTTLIAINTEGDLWQTLAETDSSNPKFDIEPQDLFYVVYTSGSTGKPKGAGVRHECEVNLLHWYTQEYDLNASDKALIISALGFDLTQKNLFALLTVGGTVVFPSTPSYDDRAIVADIDKHKITMINCAPSAFYPLVEHTQDLRQLDSLRIVLFGGEPIHLENLAPWLRRPQAQCAIVNMYGPTECTDISSSFRMDRPMDFIGRTIPIGKPNSNVKLYVLDSNQQLVPIGVPGELCVGGASVGNGYLNNPEMTAESFIKNPYGDGKIYRTGDLVRQLTDGNIEFIDRIDAQIKIRGFRIELSEIETQLNLHKAVRESVVNAVKDESNNTVLVAYIVSDQMPSSAEIRAFLKQRLPDFMMPALILPIDSIPLTPNGKIDRNALPKPEGSLRSTAYVAPRNDTEKRIAKIWRDVLSVSKVGIHDNFFELGGHSLLATRVAARLRETFVIDIALKDLFNATTVAGLAIAVEKQQGLGNDRPALLPIARDSLKPQEQLLSFAQQRLWVLDNLQKGSPMYNIPTALRISGPLDTGVLSRALTSIIERHEVLRSTFTQTLDGSHQVIHPAEAINVETDTINNLKDIEQAISDFAMAPFDLLNGPIFTVKLIEHTLDNDNGFIFLANMHHIASDGWSVGIFLRELTQLYQAYSQGQANPLPPLEIQYLDFALWQRDWLSGEVLEAQVSYWREQLTNVPVLQLATDFPRPPMSSAQGLAINFDINLELSQKLRNFSQQQQTTLFMTLLAAFQVLLYRASGQTDFCIGSPVANRSHPALDNLIGFFINTLALRTEIEPDESFNALLARVKKTCLNAYDHQDLPFERLLEALKVPRDLSHTPLFQVMFSMLNVESKEQQSVDNVNGITITPLEQLNKEHELPVKFDLQLAITDVGDQQKMTATLEFRKALFKSSTIERMAEHFETLLHSIVDNPAQAVNTIRLISKAESNKLLATGGDALNATNYKHPSTQAIHHLFEAQVERTPDAVAVRDDHLQLTYTQLNEQANRLAHYLHAQYEVNTDVMVGVCMERAVHMSIALLAILKAGGAYVPFDPSFPADRLGYMLEDAQVPVMLTQTHLSDKLPAGNTPAINLDDDTLWRNQSTENPATPVTEDQLFNVIFTSGSTGKPKGVMVPHRGIINRLLWMQSEYPLDAEDKILQKTPYSFDVSVWELFLANHRWCANCLCQTRGAQKSRVHSRHHTNS